MPTTLSSLEHQDVIAHLNRLKAEHKRLLDHELMPSLGVRRKCSPSAPAPAPAKTRAALTLTIPLTQDVLNAFNSAQGRDWKIRINDVLIGVERQE